MCNSEKLNAVIRLQCFLHNSIQIIANSQRVLARPRLAFVVLLPNYSSSSFQSRGGNDETFPYHSPVYVDRVAFNHWRWQWRRPKELVESDTFLFIGRRPVLHLLLLLLSALFDYRRVGRGS